MCAFATGAKTSVSVIDIASNAVVDSVTVGRDPVGIALTPDGRYAYVANSESGTVSVIDLTSNKVATTIPVGAKPWGIAIVQ